MKHERIYLNEKDDRVFIDTYVSNDNKIRDAVLVIPGGGYSQVCTDREGEPVALDFLANGYNAFVLNYRCGRDGDVFPCQMIDAGSAMIYVREHCKEFKINPERVFAVGFSAGGHLCGSLATMFEYREMKDAFGEKARMIRPDGAILAYPVTTARDNTHIGTFARLLGKPLSEYTDDEKTRLSIDTAATSNSSPMFIWHTREDKTVPIDGTLKLALALSALGVPYRLSVYPYGPHGIALANEVTRRNDSDFQPLAQSWTSEAREFFKTIR